MRQFVFAVDRSFDHPIPTQRAVVQSNFDRGAGVAVATSDVTKAGRSAITIAPHPALASRATQQMAVRFI